MHTFNDPLVMRQVIMDHYEHPRNKFKLNLPGARTIHMDTSGCIDDIEVTIVVERGIIKALSFDGGRLHHLNRIHVNHDRID